MNSVLILSVILTLFCFVDGKDKSCLTPSGHQGHCKLLNNCPTLLKIVSKANRTSADLDLVKQSHCGFTGKTPSVCCPDENVVIPKTSAEGNSNTPIDECLTPEGKKGNCVVINEFNCRAFMPLLQPPIRNEIIKYLERSRCGNSDLLRHCCGPVPDFENIPEGSCQSKITAFPPDPKTECCGVDSATGNKILADEAATIDQFPWLVLIEYLFKKDVVQISCGGALISGKYVLTAGHCVTGNILTMGTPTTVRLGDFNAAHEGPDCTPIANGQDCTTGATRIAIERTIPHPEYNPDNFERHDIALIRMANMAPFTDFIRPICLPTMDFTDFTKITYGRDATVAGWGTGDNKEYSDIKLYDVLPIVPSIACEPEDHLYIRHIPTWKGLFCVGGNGKDSCKGDSGGSLMYQNGRTFEAIGISSFSTTPCQLKNVSQLYTNVYEYSTWIKNTIMP